MFLRRGVLEVFRFHASLFALRAHAVAAMPIHV